MFKSLRVTAVLLTVVIAIVHGQNDSDENSESSSDDSNDNILNESTESSTAVSSTEQSLISDVRQNGLLEEILDGLDASPLGFIFRPLSLLLRPIFWIVDTALEPVFLLLQLILTPVFWLLRLIFWPLRILTDLLGNVGNIVGDSVSLSGSFVSLVISNLNGILRTVSEQTSLQRRKRRGIMDSMLGMTWTTLTYPFRFVYDIMSTLLSPFHYLYAPVTWPLHFIFGSDAGSNISTSISTVTSYLPFSATISALLLKLNDSSQGAIIELLKYAWASTKEYLLPAIDDLLVWSKDSEYVPADIKTGLSSIHSAYSVLHMFGIV